MRKKWLSFLLVLCFLVTAGSAFGAAPVVPAALNGTTWYLAGFQYNATASDDATRNNETASVLWAEQLNSTYIGPIAGMGSGLNGTASIWNNRIGLAGQNSTFFNASENNAGVANNWRVSDYYINNVDELYSINAEEGSIFFVANPSHTLMAGFANGTVAAPQDALVDLLNYNNATNGTGMYLMVQNSTITTASDVAGTWYIYGLVANATQSAASVDLPNLYGVAGKLVLNTGTMGAIKTGTVSFARNNGTADGEFLNATGVAVQWDNNTMHTIQVNATGYGNLFTGALSSDKNYMVGYNATQSGTGIDNSTALYIALKGASTFTAADFKNAAFNQVGYYNAPLGGQFQMNGTLGVIYTDANGEVTKGNSTNMFARSSNAPLVETVDLADATPVIGTTTAAGITHGTFTTRGFTFVGRKKGDVMAGLIVNSANDVVGLEVMTKVVAGTSAPAAPAAADLTSMQNDIGTTGDAAVNAGNNANLGVGVLDTGAEAVNLDTKVLQFVNATDAEKAATFGLTGTQFIDNTFPTLIFSSNGITANDFVALTFDLEGNNANVRNLPVPTKFYVNATSDHANGTNAVNTKRVLTYRNTGSAVTDGCWWITTSGANPFNALSYANDKLALGSTYTAYVVIRDNGLFDLHPDVSTVVDPIPFIGGAAPGVEEEGSSDDDDGCVFNPAASMSLEFLLLLLAPVAYLIRRRKK